MKSKEKKEDTVKNRNNSRKIKHSLKRKMTFIFIGIMFASLLLSCVINLLFLGKIYIYNKEQTMKNVYSTVYNISQSGNLSSEEFDIELEKISTSHNVNILIISSIYEPVKIYSNEPQDNLLRELRSNLGGRIAFDRLIEESDDYVLFQKLDTRTNIDYIEMCGVLPDGSFFLYRTALESIIASAKIANIVFLLVGLFTTLVSGILVYAFVGRATKPILQLADISERVSNMDFEAKYVGDHKNEIGILGNSINRMSENLESTISELKNANLELQKDIDEKTRLDNLRRDFISSASHELKTPIALIQGYAEGLKEEINDCEERDYYCDVIIDESQKMNKLVKQLLNLNQIEAGYDALSIEHFDIVSVVNNFVQSADILTKQNNISISVLNIDPIFVWADEFKIEEVVMNFFTNAIHYCESDSKHIDVTYEILENKVKVKVFNTGNNIPEESISQLWDKFYKVDKARTRTYGGSGIGLSIVKAIMDAHNQECGVFNVNDGVVFWFTLDTSEK